MYENVDVRERGWKRKQDEVKVGCKSKETVILRGV